LDIWLASKDGTTLRYDLQATGADPLFDAGEGTLTSKFILFDTNPADIIPVTGCEIELPLPDDASQIVRFPGLVSFESNLTGEDIVAFYKDALADTDWVEESEPELGDDAIIMSYLRGDEALTINIEIITTGGSKVDLIVLELS